MLFDIRDFGAVGDGVTMNTEAVQAAIDACASAGGGQILVEGGVYLTAPIRLKSFCELHLASNATLLASPNLDDYHDWEDTEGLFQDKLARENGACFIFACNADHIAITGTGTVDANGKAFTVPEPMYKETGWRVIHQRIALNTPPRAIFLANCRNVLLEKFSLINPPAGWSVFVHNCEKMVIHGIKIDCDLTYTHNDGLHINSCRDVRVSDCDITASDDAIIVRANNHSLPETHVCEGVVITNCTLVSHCAGIRIGWIRDGIIRNCIFSNLTMLSTRTGILIHFPWRGEARIQDEGREATLVENLVFDSIVMDRIFTHPIRMYLDDHANTHAEVQAIRKIYFRNIRARALLWPALEGRPDLRPEDIEFSDCSFEIINQTEDFGPYQYNGTGPEICSSRLFRYIKRLKLQNTEFTIADGAEVEDHFACHYQECADPISVKK